MGAFCFTDIDLVTKKEQVPLSEENVKSFFDLEEASNICARYHDIILPKHRPKLLAVNPGKLNGQTLWSDWFDKWGLKGLAWLSMYPEEDTTRKINDLSENENAITRRAIIFKIPGMLYEPDKCAEDEAEAYFKQAIKAA